MRVLQKLLGFLVTLGGCITATVIMLVGGLLLIVGLVTWFVPLIVAGAVICVFALVCFGAARLMADVVDGPK